MANDRIGLTFSQAEGVEPLPSQLALRTISPELAAALWAVIYDSVGRCVKYSNGVYAHKYLDDPWVTIMRVWWVTRLYKNVDEYPEVDHIIIIIKDIITSRDYIKTFDFIQFLIQRPECPRYLPKSVDLVLERTRAAYRIIDNHVLPIATEAEVAAISAALVESAKADANGPKIHLKNAAENLSRGEWAETVRESIHAVEAAAKSIEPSAATLGPALTKLQTSISLNPAMSRAYSALYGYACDEKGVRHALVFDGQSTVSERDAIFMFGACASFVRYLLSAKRIPPT